VGQSDLSTWVFLQRSEADPGLPPAWSEALSDCQVPDAQVRHALDGEYMEGINRIL
jgi:hypothetical protein